MIDPDHWERIIIACPVCESWQVDYGYLMMADHVGLAEIDRILIDHLDQCARPEVPLP
jgi:hypothetical protein